jgi:hypothetical protein
MAQSARQALLQRAILLLLRAKPGDRASRAERMGAPPFSGCPRSEVGGRTGSPISHEKEPVPSARLSRGRLRGVGSLRQFPAGWHARATFRRL